MKKQILAPSLNQQARQRGKNSHVAIGQRRPKIGLYRYIFNLDGLHCSLQAVCNELPRHDLPRECWIRSNGFQTSKVRCKHFATFYLPRKPVKEGGVTNPLMQVVCGVHHAILAGLDFFRTFQNIQRSKVFWIMYCFKVSGSPAKTHNKSCCLGHSLGWDLWEESFV